MSLLCAITNLPSLSSFFVSVSVKQKGAVEHSTFFIALYLFYKTKTSIIAIEHCVHLAVLLISFTEAYLYHIIYCLKILLVCCYDWIGCDVLSMDKSNFANFPKRAKPASKREGYYNS
jgi:hypothetical protein